MLQNNMNTGRYFSIALTLVLGSIALAGMGQEKAAKKKIRIKRGMEVVLPDTVFITRVDTILYLSDEQAKKIKINTNPYSTSTKFYDTLEKKISKKAVVGDIFDWITTNDRGKEKQVNIMQQSEAYFFPYAGYTIGTITYKSIDILEGSVIDTLQKASTKLGKLINRIHRDTRIQIVEDNLLFNAGDLVDPYQLADNERVLRRFGSIRDARIYLRPHPKKANVVDIEIVTQDVAPLGASGSFTSWQWYDVALYHVNLLGYAKQLQIAYFRNSHRSPNNGFEITARDPNMFGSFVRGQLQYADNYIHKKTRVAFERDFFAPEVKYAGGVELYRSNKNFYSDGYDTLDITYTESSMDFWAGRSIEFKKRSTLIFSARVGSHDFQDRPYVDIDSNTFLFDRTLVLGSVSLAKRNYLKANKIRGFGVTEDVPIGYALILTTGKEWNEFNERNYFGFLGTISKYFTNAGYVNVGVGLGSFISSGKPEDGALNIESIYFSNLKKVKRSQVRQFVFAGYTQGINRKINTTLLLPGKWEGDNNIKPIGTERLQMGFETVYFMPWYAYGFQFAMYHRLDVNLLAVEEKLFHRNSLFPLVEVGMRTLNDNLIFPTLSISFGYYFKNPDFDGAFQFKIQTQLQGLFKIDQVFKPRIVSFE